MPDYASTTYDTTKATIRNYRTNRWEWEDILWLSQTDHSDNSRDNSLASARGNGSVKNDVTADDWCQLVELMKAEEEARGTIILVPPEGRQELTPLPLDPRTCWRQYAAKLRNKGFSEGVVGELEKSCQTVAQGFLAKGDNAVEKNATRGMVIGSVQSGKTMHMAGVIAQAADLGFNYFIILTGIIDNLRKQTEKRLLKDLNSDEGNIRFEKIENPRRGRPGYTEKCFADRQGGYPNNTRHISVMLKNATRLYNLLQWIYNDENNQKQNMRILIIDDECDQASVNTADVANDEAARIYSLINAGYYRKRPARSNGQYVFAQLPERVVKSVNYLAYTATPYGNLLNDASENSLYPHDYILALSPSNAYWGPVQFFKLPDGVNQNDDNFNDFDNLPFVNEIDDLAEAKEFNSNNRTEPHDSLKQAILWFLCACGIRRYQDERKPVSMLVHTHNKIEVHGTTGANIEAYLNSLCAEEKREEVKQELRNCYNDQKAKLPLDYFQERFEDYEFVDDVENYPDFDVIYPFIEEIITDGAQHLMLDEDKEIMYNQHRGIYVCIDNCSQNAVQHVDGNDFRMRVAYPDDEEQEKLEFAPLFLVIGGNTLSRGLTLEGLVSSYFLRTVRTGDSLMQMGRWFGYRIGYELLPRLWITADTLAKFQGLQKMDEVLRSDLQQKQTEEKTPAEFNVVIKDLNIAGLNITAANKRQMAVPANFDFSGQMTMFATLDIRPETLRANNEFVTGFIQSFGDAWQPQRHFGRSYFVENVNWQRIDDFFNRFNRNDNGNDKFTALQNYIASSTLHQRSWTVIVPGVERDTYGTVSIQETPIQNLGISSRKVKNYQQGNWLKFQSISAYEDMLADLNPEDDFDNNGRWRSRDGVASYRYRASRNGRNNTPLLLLKPIVPKQENNQPIQLAEVLWSYYVFCPSVDGLVSDIITGWKASNHQLYGAENESEA